MAEYWPRFLCVIIDRGKKNVANVQPSCPHVWSITHVYYHIQGKRTYFGEQIIHVQACEC